MKATRQKPVINKEWDTFNPPKPDNDSMSCVIIPIGIIISYFALSAIFRVTSNAGSKLDQIICYGALIFFVIIMILGLRSWYRESNVREAEKRQWKSTCAFSDVAIVSRHHSPSVTIEDDYGVHHYRSSARLELEMNLDQRTVAPNQTSVSVTVNENIYEKVENRNTVRIYYQPESPMTFMLEEEL
jgi:hypothetical protein